MRHIFIAIAFATTLCHIFFIIAATYVNWMAKTTKNVELAILWYVFAVIMALITLGIHVAYGSPVIFVMDLAKLLITVTCIAFTLSRFEHMRKTDEKPKVNPIDVAIREFEFEHEREVAKLQAKALKELQEEYPLPKDELKRIHRYPL